MIGEERVDRMRQDDELGGLVQRRLEFLEQALEELTERVDRLEQIYG